MEKGELKPVIEALIFVSEEPISLDLMAMVFEEAGAGKNEISDVIEEIKNECNGFPERGIQLAEVAGGYQFRTKPSVATWISKLNIPKPVRLSQAAMETLAIIAYRQPVLRSGVEEIRGVDSGGVIKTLLERGLVRIIGKSDDVGNPLVYSTTQAFLEMFKLKDLRDLPTLKEIRDLEVQEKVGNLGKAEIGEDGGVSEVSEVIDEYKEEISAFETSPEAEAEDDRAITDLEKSMKSLKDLEKAIFPKPTEELKAVLRDGTDAAPNESGETDGSD